MAGRRHHFITVVWALAALLAIGADARGLRAQQATPAGSPTPIPTPKSAVSPAPKPTAAPASKPSVTPVPKPGVAPSPSPAQPGGRHRPGWEYDERSGEHPAPNGSPGGGPGADLGPDFKRFLDRIPPQERESFERNMRMWREMSPEQRDMVRDVAAQHAEQRKQEAERALKESGLNLDADQQEVFELRYMQERRKLEHELHDKLDAERKQRLPEIIQQLAHEFAGKSLPPTSATPSPSIAPSHPSPAPSVAPSPTPTPAFEPRAK